MATDVWQTRFEVIGLELDGVLAVPDRPRGVVLFVHALDGRRHHTNDASIARALNERRIATVDVNLLTAEERQADAGTGIAFDATALGARVIALADELAVRPRTGGLPAALYGAGTGAAGALIAAAARPSWVRAVFSRAVRPDLALNSALSLPDPANLIQVVLRGISAEDGMPDVVMPGFAHALSDADIARIVAYLRRTRTNLPAWLDLDTKIAAIRRQIGASN